MITRAAWEAFAGWLEGLAKVRHAWAASAKTLQLAQAYTSHAVTIQEMAECARAEAAKLPAPQVDTLDRGSSVLLLRSLAAAEREVEELRRVARGEWERARAAIDDLAEATRLAEERLAHAHQLQADIEADQEGRMALRRRFGARDDETFIAFIERLAAGHRAGVEEERRRIVEWLRACALDHRCDDDGSVRYAETLEELADDIERADHIPAQEPARCKPDSVWCDHKPHCPGHCGVPLEESATPTARGDRG